MKKLVFGITLLIACTLQAQRTDSTAGPTVRTAFGIVRGVTEGDVTNFKGIQYGSIESPTQNITALNKRFTI